MYVLKQTTTGRVGDGELWGRVGHEKLIYPSYPSCIMTLLFNQLFNNYLLNTCKAPEMFLGAKNIAVKKTPKELILKTYIKYSNNTIL